MEIIYCIAGLLVGFCISWFLCTLRWRGRMEGLKVEIAHLKAIKDASDEKIEWVKKNQQEMAQVFEVLAGKILQKSSAEFFKRLNENLNLTFEKVRTDWNLQKMEIKSLVDPLKENLNSLDTYIRDLERKREGAYKGLQEQLKNLFQINANLLQTTSTLAQALKSSSIRGRWGEIQLRRIVELAGMVKHISFEEQSLTHESGRPDMIVYLPNGGVLPVDSKVPLSSYLEAIKSEDEKTREEKLKEYARAVRTRIRELGSKRYWKQFDRTPEFVVMFVPNEQCLTCAFEVDHEIIDYGIEQKVLIATPVTLLALLKAVAYGWQQIKLADNARKIAGQAKELYDRFGVFLKHLSNLGRHINLSVEAFNQTVGSLDFRILPALKVLKEAGVSTKELEEVKPIDTRVRAVKEK